MRSLSVEIYRLNTKLDEKKRELAAHMLESIPY